MGDSGDRRALLQRQLAIMWSFAEAFVIGQISDELALWETSNNVATVRAGDQGWIADWPDEETPPLPDVTIAWLLWHIEWWWTDTISRINGGPAIAHELHRWSGGTTGIADLKKEWDEVLAEADLDAPVAWVMPEQPLWFVASWVNVELTRNLAEINQIKGRCANA